MRYALAGWMPGVVHVNALYEKKTRKTRIAARNVQVHTQTAGAVVRVVLSRPMARTTSRIVATGSMKALSR